MKQIKLIISILILPLTVMADGDHKTIELDEMTKKSMQRTATFSTETNGTITLDTSNSYRSASFVRINEDGTKETLCTTSMSEAKEFMLGKSDTSKSDGE